MRLFYFYFATQGLAALLPLSTSGRDLVDKAGARVTYAGVNWPGHMEAMIPEGLQYQSVQQIVGTIKGLGLNVIRLTYSTEMVDELLGGKSDVKAGLVRALGEKNGSNVFRKVMERNPWVSGMTRLQVFQH